MDNAKKWTLLTVYIFTAAIVFLYMLFPSDTVKSYIGYRVEKVAPDMGLDIDRLRLGMPPGLSLGNIDLRYKAKPAARFDSLELVPAYLSLFTANAAVDFNGMLAGGKMWGRTGPTRSELSFSDIRLDELPIIQTLFPVKVDGAATGELTYALDGKSNAILKLAECKFEVNPPIMGIKELTFTRIEAEAEMTGQEIVIKRIELFGPQASGKGSGAMTLRQPIEDSRINLSGTVKPNPSMMQSFGALLPKQSKEGGIPVQITGTVKQPSFSIR